MVHGREGPEEKTESWSSPGTPLRYQVKKACVDTLIDHVGLWREALLGRRSNCELHCFSALSNLARARGSGDD